MTPATELTILHWNLHGLPFTPRWRQRCAAVAQRVRDLATVPDLLLFCEVWTWPRWKILREALYPRFLPLSPVRQRALFPPGGLAAFSHAASPWRTTTHWFVPFATAAPWWRAWEGDGLAGKGILSIVLRLGAHTAAVLYGHLQAQYGRRHYTGVRAAQWNQLARSARDLARSSSLLCAAGDLNTLPTETLFSEHAAEWVDLTLALRSESGNQSTVDGKLKEWIDYILVHHSTAAVLGNTRACLLPARTGTLPISDHHGLCATLSLRSCDAQQQLSPSWLAPLNHS